MNKNNAIKTALITINRLALVKERSTPAILISGPITGYPVDSSSLRKVREHLPDLPVFANTGVTQDNVENILKIADGCIVGTHFKIDGITWNSVDEDRVRRFMDIVDQTGK